MNLDPTIYRLNFCRRLKQIRLRAGYRTQGSIADELGVSSNTYSTYESRTLVPHSLIPLLCELLDCSSWFLLTGNSWQFSPPINHESLNKIVCEGCLLMVKLPTH